MSQNHGVEVREGSNLQIRQRGMYWKICYDSKLIFSVHLCQTIVLRKRDCYICLGKTLTNGFLAHLSQRLIGELIVYPCSGVRPSSSSTISNIFFSENAYPIKANLCVASLGRGNESLFTASGSHDQDGRHAHIW